MAPVGEPRSRTEPCSPGEHLARKVGSMSELMSSYLCGVFRADFQIPVGFCESAVISLQPFLLGGAISIWARTRVGTKVGRYQIFGEDV